MILNHLLITAMLAMAPPSTQAAAPVATQSEAEEQAPELSPEARAYQDKLEAYLRQTRDPRERALGAYYLLIRSAGDKTLPAFDHQASMRQAAKDAPTDGLVQSVLAMSTYHGKDCPSACRAERSAAAQADPSNGMAWLDMLSRDLSPEETEEILKRAADADHFDDYFIDALETWNGIFAKLPMSRTLAREVLRNSGEPAYAGEDDPAAVGRMYAFAQAATFTSFGYVASAACNRNKNPTWPESRFELCARLGRKMALLGTTDMIQMLGSGLVKTSGLATDEDLALSRRLQWQMKQFGDLGSKLAKPSDFDAYYEDLVSTRSEVRAQELQLKRLGVPLNPPANWKPEYE